MVQRVLIKGGQAAVIQVSLPGFDVTTATLDQMAFDARFANMSLFQKGSLANSFNTWYTINFPQTFSTIPRVLCTWVGHNQIYGSPPIASLTNHGSYNDWVAVQVTNSYAQFGSFVNSTDPFVQAQSNGVFHYAFFR